MAEPDDLTDLFFRGNAVAEERRGWFIGQFVPEAAGLRHQKDVELKWGVHPAGDRRVAWAHYTVATTIAIRLEGRFLIRVRKNGATEEHILEAPGDYVIMKPGVEHSWEALTEALILTVRFPSLAGDQREIPDKDATAP